MIFEVKEYHCMLRNRVQMHFWYLLRNALILVSAVNTDFGNTIFMNVHISISMQIGLENGQNTLFGTF